MSANHAEEIPDDRGSSALLPGTTAVDRWWWRFDRVETGRREARMPVRPGGPAVTTDRTRRRYRRDRPRRPPCRRFRAGDPVATTVDGFVAGRRLRQAPRTLWIGHDDQTELAEPSGARLVAVLVGAPPGSRTASSATPATHCCRAGTVNSRSSLLEDGRESDRTCSTRSWRPRRELASRTSKPTC